MAKEKATRKVNRLSTSDKLMKRLKGVSPTSDFGKKTEVTVNLYAVQPEQVAGFLVDESKFGVRLRHKRTNASKRMVVTTFPHADIVSSFGAVGEASAVTVMREGLVATYTGVIKSETELYIELKTTVGETVKVYRNADVRVEIIAEDSSEPSGRGKSSKKKAAKSEGKTSKKKSKKKSKSDDDDDLEL